MSVACLLAFQEAKLHPQLQKHAVTPSEVPVDGAIPLHCTLTHAD